MGAAQGFGSELDVGGAVWSKLFLFVRNGICQPYGLTAKTDLGGESFLLWSAFCRIMEENLTMRMKHRDERILRWAIRGSMDRFLRRYRLAED